MVTGLYVMTSNQFDLLFILWSADKRLLKKNWWYRYCIGYTSTEIMAAMISLHVWEPRDYCCSVFTANVRWNFWRHVLSVSWVILPNSTKGDKNFRYPDTKNDTEYFSSQDSFQPGNLHKILKTESSLIYGGKKFDLYFTEKRVCLSVCITKTKALML